MKLSGVYQIMCLANGRVYIGSSIDVSHRWQEHKKDLCARRHHNVHLQRAWQKYGAMAFEFSVIERRAPEALKEAEQRFIDANAQGFNISRFADAPMRGRKPSARHLARMARAQLGRIHPAEVRRRISKANRGKKRTPEMVAAMKGRVVTDEARARMSAAARARCTSEWRDRISLVHKNIWKGISKEQRSARMAPILAQRVNK